MQKECTDVVIEIHAETCKDRVTKYKVFTPKGIYYATTIKDLLYILVQTLGRDN